ncbi:hypothetical protein ACP70R_003279 [Stipagrostis hirtigluma subsp. patula]
MEGKRPAEDDGSGPSQRQPVRYWLMTDDSDDDNNAAAVTSLARGGADSTRQMAPPPPPPQPQQPGFALGRGHSGAGVAPPPQPQQPGFALGRGHGGVEVAPPPQQPGGALGRGDGGENRLGLGLVVREPAFFERQNNPAAAGTHRMVRIDPVEALRRYLGEGRARYDRHHVLAGRPQPAAILRRLPDHILFNQFGVGPTSSSSSPQAPLPTLPSYYLISELDLQWGSNALQERTSEYTRLRGEVADLKQRLAMAETRGMAWRATHARLEAEVARANERAAAAEAELRDRRAAAMLGGLASQPPIGAGARNFPCVVCQASPATVELRPCRHVVLCRACFDDRRVVCPSCGAFAY